MANSIPVIYETDVKKLKTEKQVFNLYFDLKKVFEEIKSQKGFSLKCDSFIIKTPKEFLEKVINENFYFIIKGTGTFSELKIKKGSINYDLSKAYHLLREWYFKTKPVCINCEHSSGEWLAESEKQLYCKDEDINKEKNPDFKHSTELSDYIQVYEGQDASKCTSFDEEYKDEQGKVLKNLQELLNESKI